MAANRHSMPSASPSVPPAALLLTLPLYLQHQAHTVESLAPGETCSEHFLTPFSTKVRANIKTCPTFPHLPQNTAGLLKEAYSKRLQKGSTSIIYMKKHLMMEDFWAASLNSSSGILSFCWLLKDFPSKGTSKVFCWINMILHNKNNTRQFHTTHTGLSAELVMIQTAKVRQHSCAGAAVPLRRGKTMFRVAQVKKWSNSV